jgi:hypothetical protein
VIFDVLLSEEGLKDFNFLELYKTKIIAGIPVTNFNTKKSPLYWSAIANIPPVEYDIPLFVIGESEEDNKKSIVVDLTFSYCRSIPTNEIIGTSNFRNSSSRCLEDILYYWFYDTSNYKYELLKEESWHPNTLRESDMKVNPQEYQKWRGFGNPWGSFEEIIEKTRLLHRQFQNDESVLERHRLSEEYVQSSFNRL